MAEAIVGAIAPNIFERCVGAAGEHLGYIWNYKKNIANLQTQVEKLDKERDDKSHSVTVAVKNAHKIKNTVKGWQDQTDKISEETIQIINDYDEKGKKRCLMGLCPNLVSRYQFSKRACRKETEIVDAIREAGEIREVSDRAIGMGKEIVLSTESCFTFDSRKSIMEDIVQTLQDETKNSVGVYGLGGMGKTTLAKQVASHVTIEKMFEEVVMASVTQKVDMKEIQGQIASMLDLKLEESSVAERASRIHERLKGKRVLVLLDDLWTKLDLVQVGIPFGAEHMGCKVLITSRFLHVLSSMGTTKEYVLGALKEDEAWRLFEEKVIPIVENPTFLAIGKEVAKRCAGLPILIVTVAASLAKRPSLDAWNDALAQVKKMNNKNMHDIVNSAIESISYECLNETHKRLFLLCGLMQGNALFEDILKYSLGWGLFGEDSIVTVEGARNRLHALIFDLKESCLLLAGYSNDRIKMHDVVRDVAISIARKDLNAFSAGDNDIELCRWPKNDVLKKCTAMVFHKCLKLPCFPQQLECPSLELFILGAFSLDSKPTISDTFFERTSKLKVLDMSALCFPTLPSTLSFLTNLQSLHLDHCDGLQDISIVGELKKLQVLSLIGSTIQELPSSLGQLSELKLLDLNSCSKLKVIPSGLISGLSQLEELHMSRSFDRWRSEECLDGYEKSNASFAELKCLRNLSSLKVQLQDAKLLAEDLNFENWKRFEIIVGYVWDWSFRNWFKILGIKTIIALQLGTNNINYLQYLVNTLFKRTECLCLGELKGKNNVIPELNEDGFPELKHLHIATDFEIQYIVNVVNKHHRASFPALESLYLSGLRKVEKICNAGLMEGSFYHLTILNVQYCNSMESLFSFSTVTVLPCLREIQVSYCNVLGEIVVKNRREDDANNTSNGQGEKIELAQLRKLALNCLPKFMTFFFDDNKIPMVKRRQKLLTTETESQEIILEEDDFSSSLPLFEEVSFPKLEELELCEMPSLTEIWSHKLLEVTCCNLTKMTVTDCDKLKYIFTPSCARVLVRLQKLIIRHCVGMKQVVAMEEGETKTETIIFPQLSFIRLHNLPNLTTFYSESVEEMTKREKVETVTQSLFDEKVQFPSLKTLFVENLDSIRAIWPNTASSKKDSFCKREFVRVTSCASLLQTFSSTMSTTDQIDLNDKPQGIPIFQNLSEVTINECKSLRFVFPTYVARSLNQLMKVCVEDCGVETIISDHEDIELEKSEARTTTFTLPKLVTIKLKGLRKMECFYSREHTIEWPALKVFQVVDCDKLHVLDFLRSPGKQGEDRIPKVPANLSFSNLLEMEIKGCVGLKYLFTPSIAMSFEKVHKLTIAECSMMQAIVGNEGGEAITDMITFPQLIYLSLEDLPNLTRFYCVVEEIDSNEKLDSDVKPLFTEKIQLSRLEKLNVYHLDNINTIWQSQQLYDVNSFCKLEEVTVSSCAGLLKIFPSMSTSTKINLKNESQNNLIFQNLCEVTVCSCKSLKYVFPASMAGPLNQLKTVTVIDCGVETIVGDDEGGEAIIDRIAFPQLIDLTLIDLPNLTRFYYVVEEIDSNELQLDSNVQPLFTEKIQFPRLEKLIVDCLDNINTIWQSQQLYGVSSFCKLEEVKVRSCASLLKIFPSTMSTSTKINLKNESQNNLIFQNLCKVTVCSCKSLKYVFPASMAGPLNQLKTVTVIDCGVETIVGDDEGGEAIIDRIAFPQLIDLTLIDLPNLTRFYHAVEEMDSEEKLDSRVQPLFTEKVQLPSLKTLRVINLDRIKAIQTHNQPSTFPFNSIEKVPTSMSFKNLFEMEIQSCVGLMYLFTPSIAMGLEKVQKLTIAKCSMMKAIVGNEGGEAIIDKITFPQLFHLSLEDLPNLVKFCSKVQEMDSNEKLDYDVQPLLTKKVISPLKCLSIRSKELSTLLELCDQNILDRLEDLRVTECPCLTNLVPPFVSFRLLKKLRISNCGGLRNLLQPSTATSLEQLEFLDISGCEMIEEIIGGEVREDDEESSSSCRDNGIIFNKLLYLRLEELPRLTNFCSSLYYTFNFPKLIEVYVIKCLSMKTFCGGITTTPKLNIVFLNYSGMEHRWEGELNTTVEKIYEERLATRPSILATNHSEAQTQQERVAGTYTCEKGKGKEVEASEQGVEHFEISETTRYSDPSYSNCTASSSWLTHQISSHLATQVEAHAPAATVSTISSNNQLEAQAQIHDLPPEKSTMEPRKEGQVCRNNIGELGDKAEIGKNATKPEKESEDCENFIRTKRETDICEKVVKVTKEVDVSVKEAQRLTAIYPSISSNGQFEPESHKKSIEEHLEPTNEVQISKNVINELGMGTSLAASSSQLKTFSGLRVAKDFSQSLSDLLQILETQPLKSMNEEQFQSMEGAFRTLSNMNFSLDLLCPYVHKARKCMERKRKVCELELKIAEAEERVHAMREEMKGEKKVLEEEYEAIQL